MSTLDISSATSSSVKDAVIAVRDHLEHEVIGQSHLVKRMLMGLLCGGHILVELSLIHI